MGFQTLDAVRPRLQSGPPPAPVVDIALVRPRKPEPVRAVDKITLSHKRKGLFVTAAMVKGMKARRREGWTLHQIAAEWGVAHTTVYKHTRDVPPPEGGWSDGAQPPLFSANEAARLRRAGLTYQAIADEMGCAYGTVFYLLNPRERASNVKSQVSVRVQAVARWSGYSCKEIRALRNGPAKKAEHSLNKARQILWWTLHKADGMSYAAIGRELGGYHCTTIRDGCHRVEHAVAALGLSIPQYPAHLVRPLLSADWPQFKALNHKHD
jgi:DNA-binding CsgD family transcriptional regulator